jgi:hypothetical protein
MVTPGTTAPVVSRTNPEIAAEKPCPNTKPLANTINITMPISDVAVLVTLLPILLPIPPPFF